MCVSWPRESANISNCQYLFIKIHYQFCHFVVSPKDLSHIIQALCSNEKWNICVCDSLKQIHWIWNDLKYQFGFFFLSLRLFFRSFVVQYSKRQCLTDTKRVYDRFVSNFFFSPLFATIILHFGCIQWISVFMFL